VSPVEGRRGNWSTTAFMLTGRIPEVKKMTLARVGALGVRFRCHEQANRGSERGELACAYAPCMQGSGVLACGTRAARRGTYGVKRTTI
jgi:hypothetical protein